MRVSANEARTLLLFIKEEIEKNFRYAHLSENLINTIEIKLTETGFELIIPASMYDLDKFINSGVVVYTGEGSYAEAVNISGGFSGTHKGYVETAVNTAISRWINAMSDKYKMVSKRG